MVYLSGVGATPDSNLKIIRAHGIAEKIYEHYGYSLTILRPSWFMEVNFPCVLAIVTNLTTLSEQTISFLQRIS